MISTQLYDSVRAASEKSLFYFARTVLGLPWLSVTLHKDMCEFMTASGAWAQSADQRRRLCLVPRDHVKTTLVKAQIAHLAIQPAAQNIYFPGVAGVECRCILAGETSKNASRHLSAVENIIENNPLFKALWPQVKPGRVWNQNEMTLQRSKNYSEPFCEALGTDTAIASRHVDWIFCDDLVTFEAWQSASVMERVRLWFTALEPILDETENSHARLSVTGTAWSESDVYKMIIDSIAQDEELGLQTEWATYVRGVVENGAPIWPERFPLSRLQRIELRSRASGLWDYNWMNNYGNSEFSDLRTSWLGEYRFSGDELVIV